MNLIITRRDGSVHEVLFDEADAELLMAYKWHIVSIGRSAYAATNVKREDGSWTTIQMHRLLLDVPAIDHINHDGLDNRRSNLRPCSVSQNAANRRGWAKKQGQGKYKGVFPRGNKWAAYANGKYIGLYETPEEAALGYDQAAVAAWGEYAHTNFPKVGQ